MIKILNPSLVIAERVPKEQVVRNVLKFDTLLPETNLATTLLIRFGHLLGSLNIANILLIY